MGGPYNIPRNYKGENKILFIFSMKSFLFTIGAGAIGVIFYFILKIFNLATIGIIFVIVFALLGFIIGTFKIPDNTSMEFTRKVGGEAIDTIIIRWFKFKRKNSKIYVYKKEEAKDG